MRWPRKVSNKPQTSVKFSKNPSGKTLQNCFIHKSSTRSGHWNEQNSYYSPPLVGKSHEEDTITTHFDWKKQNPILLVDRWEDQTATEDTTATLQHITTPFPPFWLLRADWNETRSQIPLYFLPFDFPDVYWKASKETTLRPFAFQISSFEKLATRESINFWHVWLSFFIATCHS